MNKKAVIYARVSSTGDRQDTARQVEDLTAYARNNGLTPSGDDKRLTHLLAEAGKLVEVRLIEHIIIGGNGVNDYYSFHENGLI